MFSKIRTIQTGIIRKRHVLKMKTLFIAPNLGQTKSKENVNYNMHCYASETGQKDIKQCQNTHMHETKNGLIEDARVFSIEDDAKFRRQLNPINLVSLLNNRDAIFKDVIKRIDNQSLRKLSIPMTIQHNNKIHPFENGLELAILFLGSMLFASLSLEFPEILVIITFVLLLLSTPGGGGGCPD
jgi:hypothetical protein